MWYIRYTKEQEQREKYKEYAEDEEHGEHGAIKLKRRERRIGRQISRKIREKERNDSRDSESLKSIGSEIDRTESRALSRRGNEAWKVAMPRKIRRYNEQQRARGAGGTCRNPGGSGSEIGAEKKTRVAGEGRSTSREGKNARGGEGWHV